MFVFILASDYIVGPRQQCYKTSVCWTETSGCPIGKTKKEKVLRTSSGQPDYLLLRLPVIYSTVMMIPQKVYFYAYYVLFSCF
jgi:hypothetical protein